ncbi:hypothetical protein L226DRAFT_533462 [Lentinus tigrinus ALCF2SS1-7]|uniref:Uncharacterized protein n=1 Tax=Lentinus tigrinus ALCF2SS1-6 TaxID=1328759 RepID=A0A5C2SRZ6_9APHY|nr:hypothetical protein L227DRAFT_650359 [Lentinus tigrinus ALCF2SS1-6]RPD76347.1 hypothetical protein L226DRAFT_533462 [Lentinus tigrinus ALCF2SS1-7]
MSGSTSTTSANWDITSSPVPLHAHSAPSGPTLSKRRGQSHSGADHKRARRSDDMPFPRRSTSRDSSGHDNVVPREHAQRTVRRKKSSLDLRDIFLHGGLFPSGPSATS